MQAIENGVRIDKVVRGETARIAAWSFLFSVIMQAVFFLIGRWDGSVLLGNLLGYGATVLNYFGIGLTVQRAVDKQEQNVGQSVKRSSTVRMLFLFAVAVLAVALDCFNVWAVIIPLLFPRMAIALRMLWDKKRGECT